MKEITKIILLGLAIRLALTPFFIHLWDMATIQDSLNSFFRGINPYTHYGTITRSLQVSSGLPIFFEGYAYLPHLLYIYSPFYALYLLSGADPTPIKNAQTSSSPLETWFSPDVYFFNFMIKLPPVLMDISALYCLYQFKRKLGIFYALSPYVIFISSVWGMFDSLLAISLLLSLLLLSKNKFLAGIFFSLSLIKPITLLALPLYLITLIRNKAYKSLFHFILGIVLFQLPTLYFYFLDAHSFLINVFYFQIKRIGGGITPLNVIWNIPDLFFDLAVTSYATIVFLIAYITLLYFVIREKVTLTYGVLIMILCYMLLGKVVNEQYLVIIYPLLLLTIKDFTRDVDKYILTFILIRSTPVYFVLPLLALFPFFTPLLTTWYSWLSIDYVNLTRFFLLYVIGLLFFLKVAEFLWLTHRKYIRSKEEN